MTAKDNTEFITSLLQKVLTLVLLATASLGLNYPLYKQCDPKSYGRRLDISLRSGPDQGERRPRLQPDVWKRGSIRRGRRSLWSSMHPEMRNMRSIRITKEKRWRRKTPIIHWTKCQMSKYIDFYTFSWLPYIHILKHLICSVIKVNRTECWSAFPYPDHFPDCWPTSKTPVNQTGTASLSQDIPQTLSLGEAW